MSANISINHADVGDLQQALLGWFMSARRNLPWRLPRAEWERGERPAPYRVWLSEIMLQQTTVPHAAPYFLKFADRWPSVEALAAASEEDVLAAWAGLGYYARARRLHACARHVADTLGGAFPDAENGLLALPGVGPYTAAAIAAIAFGRPAAVVDGNVERVMSRLGAIKTPTPKHKKEVNRLAALLADDKRPGDHAEALMDLGATVCTPREARCGACPLRLSCRAAAEGAPERYPVKGEKRARPHRKGAAFVLTRGCEVYLIRRAREGLLGGMAAFPTTEWREQQRAEAGLLKDAPVKAEWRRCPPVHHVFTHFSLELAVWRAEASETFKEGKGWWTSWDGLDEAGLPSVMRKVAASSRGSYHR